jgi:predicted RNA-binding Zn-ribbon protein involved in translation (DUF1610 family)
MNPDANVTCASCAQVFKVKVKEMVPGKKKHCPNCKAEMVFSKEDGRKSQQMLADINKSMKNRFG